MKCLYCPHEETRVIDSREGEDLSITRRRRECEKCGKRFTTYERAETELIVVKKDGRREKLSRDKLKIGFVKACEKRPVSTEKIEELCDEVERDLLKLESTEVPSFVIGELAMKKLKKVDEIAYNRFASVYRAFKDLEEFEKELEKLKR